MQGIYQIKSLKTGKLYIGKSVELQKRHGKHLTLLRRDKHYNSHLQRHYNKYGEKDLEYSILEETFNLNRNELSKKEIYWIKKEKAFGNGNFNQTKGGDGSGDTYKRKIQLKNINTGKIEEFESLSEAGRQLNLSPSDIHRLLDGERIKRLGAWTTINHNYTGIRKNQREFTLYHDEYGEIRRTNMIAFAREIGTFSSVIYNLITGKIKNCKGWRTTKIKAIRKKYVHKTH